MSMARQQAAMAAAAAAATTAVAATCSNWRVAPALQHVLVIWRWIWLRLFWGNFNGNS